MSGFLDLLWAALTFQGGYNTALVALGAGLLGLSAGAAGVFVFLRKRALVSDAISHATLPGVCLAFIGMVALGGEGRWLPGLMLGSALSAMLGLVLVDWMARRTRLSEDATIGAVLSVFFGIGVVLLTVIQGMSSGRQAGLEGFLLGSTAGMLASEAVTIALAGLGAGLIVFILRRPMTLVTFDPGYAATQGVHVQRTDLAIMGLALIVTVIGLKVVGLILIVALLIIPPVIARFWTDRVDRMVLIAGASGAASGYLGAAISAAGEGIPTGPVIVLSAFAIFAVSLLISPKRGVLAAALRHRRFQRRVHRQQGLLALARGEPLNDTLTRAILRREGLIRADMVATEAGAAAAARALRDAARWAMLRRVRADDPLLEVQDGVTALADLLTADQIAEIDRRIGGPSGVGA